MEAEEEFNRFLRSHRVVSTQKQLVVEGGTAYWCFCVEYLSGAQPVGSGSNSRSRVDYKAVLSEADFALFARLRDARKELAGGEAVPVYAVCTNEQLAEMARRRVTTIGELKKIDGFGEAKADKYGEALLAAMRDNGTQRDGEKDETDRQSD